MILRIPRSSDDHCQGFLEFALEFGAQFVVVEHVDEAVEGVGDSLTTLLPKSVLIENEDKLGFSDLFEDGLEEVGHSDDSDVVSRVEEAGHIDETGVLSEVDFHVGVEGH